MIILFVNKYMFFLNEFICLTVEKYMISLKLNKYNPLKLHKYTVAGCKIMPLVRMYFVKCEYILVLCVLCEQRPLVYHEKRSPLLSPRKMFMCPHDKSAIIIEISFFTIKKASGRGCNPCGRLGKLTSGN